MNEYCNNYLKWTALSHNMTDGIVAFWLPVVEKREVSSGVEVIDVAITVSRARSYSL